MPLTGVTVGEVKPVQGVGAHKDRYGRESSILASDQERTG